MSLGLNKSFKFLLDARMLHSSGIGRFIRNLIKVLNQEKVSGVILIGDTLNSDEILNFKKEIWLAAIYSVKEQIGHPEFWKAINQDTIIHAPHFNHPLLVPAPDVLTIYDLTHLEYPDFFAKRQITLLRLLLPIVLHRTKFIHAISHATANSLIKFFPFTENKIRVVHLGIENSFIPSTHCGSAKDYPTFLYVGNLKPHKNLSRLLDAFSLVISEFPEYRLKIIGKDFLSQQLEREVASRNLRGKVILEGEISEEKLIKNYQNATALIHPSLSEGFGFTPLEAMACGTPALISRAGSLPEVCGDAALYFDPLKPEEIAARMKQIVLEKNLRQEMIERGKARAKEFTWEKCVDGIIELYKEAASKK